MKQTIEELAQNARERIKNEAFYKTDTGNALDISLTREIITEALTSRDQQIREVIEKAKLVKDYDGNNLKEACRKYSIGAESWTEILRYEDGYNQAIHDILLTLKEN